MGTGDERHQGPVSGAVRGVARLRAQEGGGVRVVPPGSLGAAAAAATRAESSEPCCQPRDPGPGPRAEGSREAREEVLGQQSPPEGVLPPLVPRPPGPPRARGDHLHPSPPPPLVQVHPGLPPPGRPRTRSWREPIKAGDGATRGHTVQAPEQPLVDPRQLLPCPDQRRDHGPSLGIRQAQRTGALA